MTRAKNPDPAEAPAPLLVVMWRGNRVVVHGGDPMRTTARRPDMGIIAGCINSAASVPAMLTALRVSTIGENHEIEAAIEDQALVIRLVERPGVVTNLSDVRPPEIDG